MSELFQTQRSRLVRIYEKAQQPFVATTKPYKSTRPLIFSVVEARPTAGPVMAHAVARAGQQLIFFNYGVGDDISDGFGGTFEATDADTNQGDSNNTNGNNDFVMEGVSASCKGVRIQYAPGVAGGPAGGGGAPITDGDVLPAYEGGQSTGGGSPPEISDPGSLMAPPQVDSPFNLQCELMEAAAPSLAVQFVFDREKTEKIGTLDEIPEGGAKGYLKAHGDPRTDNRYRIPEGYMWRRAGEPDSNFNTILTLKNPIVIPITLIGLFGTLQSPIVVPVKLALDITIRVHGLNVRVPSNNG